MLERPTPISSYDGPLTGVSQSSLFGPSLKLYVGFSKTGTETLPRIHVFHFVQPLQPEHRIETSHRSQQPVALQAQYLARACRPRSTGSGTGTIGRRTAWNLSTQSTCGGGMCSTGEQPSVLGSSADRDRAVHAGLCGCPLRCSGMNSGLRTWDRPTGRAFSLPCS